MLCSVLIYTVQIQALFLVGCGKEIILAFFTLKCFCYSSIGGQGLKEGIASQTGFLAAQAE